MNQAGSWTYSPVGEAPAASTSLAFLEDCDEIHRVAYATRNITGGDGNAD